MADRTHLQLVNTETGEVSGCARCEDVQVGDVENLERLVRSLNRKIANMERDREAERQRDEDRTEIERLFGVWTRATNHPRAMLGPDRFDAIKAALMICRKDYEKRVKAGESPPLTPEQVVELALEGIGAFPYVVNGQRVEKGPKAARHDRIGIALDGSENIERFANLGHQARKGRGARAA